MNLPLPYWFTEEHVDKKLGLPLGTVTFVEPVNTRPDYKWRLYVKPIKVTALGVLVEFGNANSGWVLP